MEWLEDVIGRDPGGRGVAGLRVPGDLRRAAHVLAGARRVLLITGFAVGPAGVAETDGPPGTLLSRRALAHLGKDIIFATHPSCQPVMAAGIERLALDAPLEVLGRGESPAAILARQVPDAIVAIELPGRSADGEYYNMRGESITRKTTPLDGLLPLASERGIPTVAVGDGGNEAGMGKVIEQVRAVVRGGHKIASVVAADYLIAAGTSNWGCYGLVAALDQGLLPQPQEEADLIASLVAVGALDGVRLKPETTVDGIDADRYQQPLVELRTQAAKLMAG